MHTSTKDKDTNAFQIQYDRKIDSDRRKQRSFRFTATTTTNE